MDKESPDPPGAAPVKTAIVGSTNFFPDPLLVLRLIESNPGEILTRRTRTSGIDVMVEGLCLVYGHECKTYDMDGPSRGGTFVRDLSLIKDADKIIAIFAPDRIMEGGTGHIVNKALDERKEVEAYTIDDAGELVLVGGHNPRTDSGT
jgi:hypothetical protein